MVAKIKVYRFRRRISGTDQYRISTRMATREWIESSKTVELIEGTEVEIDSEQLVPGEAWTERNFAPKNSK
jgi:hypothetical protein